MIDPADLLNSVVTGDISSDDALALITIGLADVAGELKENV